MGTRIRRILAILYPCAAFLLPLQTRWIVREARVGWSIWEYGRISLYGFDIVLLLVGAMVVWIIARSITRPLSASVRWLWLFIFVFILYELFVSLDPFLTAVVLARVGLGCITAWFLITHCDGLIIRHTLGAFVIAVVISAGLGALQFFVQDSLIASKWLGIAWQDPGTLGVSVVEHNGGRWLRAHGTMPHPNALGGFSALGLMVFLMLITARRTVATGPLRLRISEASRGLLLQGWPRFCRNILFMLAPLILIAGIITSASRAALISAFLGIVLFAFLRRKELVRHAPLLGVGILGACMIFFVSFPFLSPRFTAQGRLEALSIQRRLTAFSEARVLVRNYGALGTGMGTYTLALQTIFPEKPIWDQQPVHNVPLLLLVEMGLGGLCLLGLGLVLWVKVQSPKSKVQNKFKSSNFKIFLPVMVCWSTLAMLDHYIWTLPAGLYLSIFLWWIVLYGMRINPVVVIEAR